MSALLKPTAPPTTTGTTTTTTTIVAKLDHQQQQQQPVWIVKSASSSSSSSVCLPLSLCLLLLPLHLPAAIALPTRCKYMKLICTHFVARLRTVYGVQCVLPPSPPPAAAGAAPLGTLGLLRSCYCCCCFLAQTICKRFLISVLNCNKIDAHLGPHCGAVAQQTQLSSTLGDNKESK